MPRSLKALQTSRTYTLRPPLAFSPNEAVGEVCMDMTAIRLGARSEINLVGSATVGRSRVEPAPRDAAKPRTRDRRAGRHITSKRTRFLAIPCRPHPWGGRRRPQSGRCRVGRWSLVGTL